MNKVLSAHTQSLFIECFQFTCSNEEMNKYLMEFITLYKKIPAAKGDALHKKMLLKNMTELRIMLRKLTRKDRITTSDAVEEKLDQFFMHHDAEKAKLYFRDLFLKYLDNASEKKLERLNKHSIIFARTLSSLLESVALDQKEKKMFQPSYKALSGKTPFHNQATLYLKFMEQRAPEKVSLDISNLLILAFRLKLCGYKIINPREIKQLAYEKGKEIVDLEEVRRISALVRAFSSPLYEDLSKEKRATLTIELLVHKNIENASLDVWELFMKIWEVCLQEKMELKFYKDEIYYIQLLLIFLDQIKELQQLTPKKENQKEER